jgi:hypothetical protein
MRTTLTLASALVLATSLPMTASAQNNGRGGDNRGEARGGDRADKDRGGGRGADVRTERRQDRDDRGPGRDRSGRGEDRGRGGDDRDRIPAAVRAQAQVVDNDRGRGQGRGQGRDDDRVRDLERDLVRRADPRVVDGDDLRFFRDAPSRGLINGCPPGLARKDNGCLPPGQARKIARAARFGSLWNRGDDFTYRYDDGYLYRLSPQGSLLGYMPALGGALGLGNPWPAQYAYQPAPAYYSNYFGLRDGYDYRYADGVLYGVDPRTQAISQVAALLTGQPWTVGQTMPTGYDVYNVPYAYRSQYMDGPDRMYRYSDGYVYQVDPTTQLVQAVIQLLV